MGSDNDSERDERRSRSHERRSRPRKRRRRYRSSTSSRSAASRAEPRHEKRGGSMKRKHRHKKRRQRRSRMRHGGYTARDNQVPERRRRREDSAGEGISLEHRVTQEIPRRDEEAQSMPSARAARQPSCARVESPQRDVAVTAAGPSHPVSVHQTDVHSSPEDTRRVFTTNTTSSKDATRSSPVLLQNVVNAFDKCRRKYHDFGFRPGVTYCNATFDSFLCWPPTEAGNTAYQNCPPERLSDTSRLAFRRCGHNGLWLGRRKNEYNEIGWTNYTPCFPAEVQNLLGKVYDDKTDPQAKFEIALNTRHMEIIGFSVSLVALLISLFIFLYYRSLRNTRTKIHTMLHVAMIIQVIIRLILYSDQEIKRTGRNHGTLTHGLTAFPYTCVVCYILLEYAISAMFTWMFIEGLFLYSVLTSSSLRERISYNQYCIIGWGFPLITTGAWVIATYMHYSNENVDECWYGYNFLYEYWFLEAPRATVMMINFFFLLNIVSVVVSKLQVTEVNEKERAKKAVRAALVLLPLLGITNVLNMVPPPLDGSVWVFACWSYVTHFLRSFEGFFIAFIYCFMNAEVREVICRQYNDWRTMRNDQRRRRTQNAQFSRQCREDPERKQVPVWVSDALNPHFGISDMDKLIDLISVRSIYSNPHVLDNLPVLRMDTTSDVPRVVCDGYDNFSAIDFDLDIDAGIFDHSSLHRRRSSSDSDLSGVRVIQVAADVNAAPCEDIPLDEMPARPATDEEGDAITEL